MKRVRIVGCGARDRGDDEAGLLAATALRERLPPQIEVLQTTAGGPHVLDWCADVETLVLIDAARATAQFPVGSSVRVAYPAQRHLLVNARIAGTHALSLVEALRLTETLGKLPPTVFLFLLAGDQFTPGTGLSEALRGPLARMVEDIRREADEWVS